MVWTVIHTTTAVFHRDRAGTFRGNPDFVWPPSREDARHPGETNTRPGGRPRVRAIRPFYERAKKRPPTESGSRWQTWQANCFHSGLNCDR